VVLETVIDLPANRIGGGSELILRDVSWSVQVTINGTDLPPATGGMAPIHVPVGQFLQAGANTIRIVVSGPKGISPLLSGQTNRRARLGEPPELVLKPTGHIDHAWVKLVGDLATAQAIVGNAPPGSRIHFAAVLDGQTLQDLGQAEVIDGGAHANPAKWQGPLWHLSLSNGPALFNLVVTLISKDGDLLDRTAIRTGLRSFEFVDQTLRLNGKQIRLIGQRVRPKDSLGYVAKLTAAAGHNVVEYHGRLPSSDELAQADERGLAVVILPRCPGMLKWRRLSPEDRATGPCVLPDEHLVQSLSANPSVLLWILEPAPDRDTLPTQGLLTDPLARPIVGHHLPGQALATTGRAANLGPAMFQGRWITEMASQRESAQDLNTLPARMVRLVWGGAVGGIVHGPPRGRDRQWTEIWQDLLSKQENTPWLDTPQRAESRVEVTGLQPGELVWLNVPGLASEGSLADGSGTARLGIWHQGQAGLVVSGETIPVTLSAGRWEPDGWRGVPTLVTLPGTPSTE
jgi:hypothetical protein